MRAETHHGLAAKSGRPRAQVYSRLIRALNWRRLLALAFNVAVWALLIMLARWLLAARH